MAEDTVRGAKKSKKPRSFSRGRQLDPKAQKEIREIFAEGVGRRDRLIEYLHRIQDHFGSLSLAHLSALAHDMEISQGEIHEVASFYHHFDIVRDGEKPPVKLTLRLCNSLPCMMAGSGALLRELKETLALDAVRIVEVPCIGRCDKAPACQLGKYAVDNADTKKINSAVAGDKIQSDMPDYQSLAPYLEDGGYDLLKSLRDGKLKPDDLIECLSASGLKGLGGAGFPAGKKWSIVRSYEGPRLMTVNADEGEPGTFKDRFHLESEPHRILEGALIAAHVVEAERIFIYIRDEYPAAHEILIREIAALKDGHLIGPGQIELRRGAGAYICGEESAMIESIEGKRGLPRLRPPYIAECGLFGRPTLNHNVETLFWLRAIIEQGADWFASQGVRGAEGLRSFSVSGRVRKPGVIIAPAGATANELIARAGGMIEGHQFRAYLPGGASGGILPASLADIPLDFGSLEQYGSFIGSHALIVLSDQDDIMRAAQNLIAFFAHETCGQCTPCRLGCEKAKQLMTGEQWDVERLAELSDTMIDASICGLGQAAPNPFLSVLRHWPELLSGPGQPAGEGEA